MNAKSLLQLALLCTVAAYFKPSFHRKENGYFVRFFGEDDSVAGIRDGNEDIVVDSLEVIERQQNVLVRQPLHVSHKIVDNSSEQQNNSKLFGLPELSDFLRDEKRSKSNRGSKARRNKRTTERNAVPKVNRKNQEDYTKVLQLNPFADADNEIFVEEVC